MIERRTPWDVVKLFDEKETAELFVPLRDRIFDMSGGNVRFDNDRIFRQDGWLRVLIRGGLFFSDRSQPPREAWGDDEWLLMWVKDDLRDPLVPLFEMLVEDGIDEIVHMSSEYDPERNFQVSAIATPPTRTSVNAGWFSRSGGTCGDQVSRLLFDRTGQWGFYADFDYLGILGGTPVFMERYIERAGGMEFIREKADNFFRRTYSQWKLPTVPHAYKLAGWDDPPPAGCDDVNDEYWRLP